MDSYLCLKHGSLYPENKLDCNILLLLKTRKNNLVETI